MHYAVSAALKCILTDVIEILYIYIHKLYNNEYNSRDIFSKHIRVRRYIYYVWVNLS